MGERPILFSGAMVRALLAGTKTQTRRVVKSVELARGEARGVRVAPGTFCYLDFDGVPGLSWRPFGGSPTVPYPPEKVATACPYGAPGDRLWVRETWRTEELADGTDGVRFPDGAFCACENTPEVGDAWGSQHSAKSARRGTVWRPSIHMPRWASRLTLEVTGVRVERLQDISEADARAEGAQVVPFYPDDGFPLSDGWTHVGDDGKCVLYTSARDSFRALWESINGADSWVANPWVWVVAFKRVTP